MTSDADDKMLEAGFAQMREAKVAPSEDLLNKIMLDADLVQSGGQTAVAQVGPKQGMLAAFLDAIGGWGAFSGLAAATVAGVWIGVVQPAALTDFSTGAWGDTVEVPLLESDFFSGLEG